jgi:hypothetical protein
MHDILERYFAIHHGSAPAPAHARTFTNALGAIKKDMTLKSKMWGNVPPTLFDQSYQSILEALLVHPITAALDCYRRSEMEWQNVEVPLIQLEFEQCNIRKKNILKYYLACDFAC